ncbi:MAG: polyprenyl synthetase family protein [Planctomycetales bacterium]
MSAGMSDSAALVDETWKVLRARVDERLARCLDAGPDCPPRLREAMAYSLLGGGKRLRPVLALSACEAACGEFERALPAACALELVHTYSLIHDDLPAMDDDDLRRGRPTNHVQFGEALAILAGDALLTLAFEIIARDVQPAGNLPPEVAVACCADLAAGAGMCGMVGGQAADIEAEAHEPRGGHRPKGGPPRFEPGIVPEQGVSLDGARVDHRGDKPRGSSTDLDVLQSIHRRKTGRLIQSAVTIGARIGGAAPETFQALENYGRSVGLAFQIADDLLDVTGCADRMGKAVGKDSAQGKLTYPALLGEEESRRRCREAVEAAGRAIAPLGERGRRLEALAQFVLRRDH